MPGVGFGGPSYNQIPGTTPTAPYNTGSSPVQDQEDLTSQIQSIQTQAGVTVPTDQPMSEDQILQLYQTNQINSSDPVVAQYAQYVAQITDPKLQAQQVNAVLPAFQEQHPADQTSYGQALRQYGLQDITPSDFMGAVPHAAETKAAAFKKSVLTRNGVYFFRNGVIADPNASAPIYPADPKVTGSPMWVDQAMKTWDQARVENWRNQLRKQGYTVSKKGGWDTTLVQATRMYYDQKYMHGGTPVPAAPSGSSGSSGTRTPPLDLHQLRGQISSQVVQQYQSIYGQDPTDRELESWTRFIINQGMQLQQGGPKTRLSAEAAVNEAEARAAEKLYNSPTATTLRENQQENTLLHDALTSAIIATNGL